jgi:thiol-disulfide isomerase/thioredoxin
MKKIPMLLFALLAIAACTKENSKEYLSFSGKLENNVDSIITISLKKESLKTIKIQTDGTFKDTLKVDKGGVYTFATSQNKKAPIYLKNGFDIKLNGNSEEFMTSFVFSGKGAANSNFVIAQIKESQNLGNPALILEMEAGAFKNKMEAIKKKYDSILKSYKNIDSSLVAMANQQTSKMMNYFNQTYSNNKATAKGTPSPKFEDYADFKGGKKSLASFKGKYVYIDIWATWCGPCIKQIPFLSTLEEEYHDKNIAFVSISTDESRRSGGSWDAAEKKWKDFVEAKQLSGTQLWAGQDLSFQKAYQINAIPRFILIDPQGNIVNANAPRPSDPILKEIFTSLGI